MQESEENSIQFYLNFLLIRKKESKDKAYLNNSVYPVFLYRQFITFSTCKYTEILYFTTAGRGFNFQNQILIIIF